MKIKKRIFEEVEIPTKQINLESNLKENNIYYISSKTIEAKGTNESISLFANITYGDKQTQNENNTSDLPIDDNVGESEEDNDIKLDAPPKKSPLEFTVGTDEVFNSIEEDNESEENINEANESSLLITFFIELEGVFYRIKDFEYNISFERFEPLFEVFKNKNSLDANVFLNLTSNECKITDLFYDESEVKGLFRKGNIDLSINEIFNNRKNCIIDKVSITNEHANIVLRRFEGNQVIYYQLDNNVCVNESLYNCMKLFTSYETSLKDFENSFTLKQTI